MRESILLICISCLVAVACGEGSEVSIAEASDESSGAEVMDEMAADEEAESEPEPEAAPAPSGP